MRNKFTRRSFVNRMGLSSASLAFLDPVLSSILNEAEGAVNQTPRVIFINTGHGIKEDCVKCENYTGPGQFQIPKNSVALEPFKIKQTFSTFFRIKLKTAFMVQVIQFIT